MTVKGQDVTHANHIRPLYSCEQRAKRTCLHIHLARPLSKLKKCGNLYQIMIFRRAEGGNI